ncbi:uncharacterized protein EDB91DRAFT_1251786 [Suillus paluster]|uniref:uncharacterized protein n=1 Tax=Suillus paluster TaxID=48578 RepID=UPI001B861E3D|nr:uncharacterized protein EDB91DRAFT_1251786 [Suillus paluster]KAG1732433.1 hypothetical protein EDB91DRAFT_1251786 [Suillus paluster]
MSNVWLYMPQCTSILRLIQLASEPHLFVTFTGAEFILIGYLADYDHIYPIYCDRIFEDDQPWIHALLQVGTLVVPGKGDINYIHNLFAITVESGAYVRSINSTCCRPGVKGLALPSWLLPELNGSVQFHHAPFPLGYLPPERLIVADSCAVETPTFSTSMQFPSGHSPLEHFDFADPVLPYAMEMPTFSTPAPGLDCTDFTNSDFNFYDQSTGYSASGVDEQLTLEETNEIQLELVFDEQPQVVPPSLEWRDSISTVDGVKHTQIFRFMRRSPWNRIITLTKCLFVGGLWTGASGNPFRISVTNTRCLITNCFLTSLDMAQKTYEAMESQPVIMKISKTETVSVGWPVLHLSLAKLFSSAKSDLGKVLKGAMSAHPNFATKMSQKAISFVLMFNSGKSSQVQQAISDLISHQIFREVLWASLLYPIEGLSDGKRDGRIGNLFPEESFLPLSFCIKLTEVVSIYQIYHTLLLIMKDGKKKRKNKTKIEAEAGVGNKVEAEVEVEVEVEVDADIDIANILEPAPMNDIIMTALDHMYDQPHMFPAFSEAVRSLPFIMSTNVLQIATKLRHAKSTISDTTGDRRMNLEDIQPIIIQPIPTGQFGALPNGDGFSSPRSLRVIWDLPISLFTHK